MRTRQGANYSTNFCTEYLHRRYLVSLQIMYCTCTQRLREHLACLVSGYSNVSLLRGLCDRLARTLAFRQRVARDRLKRQRMRQVIHIAQWCRHVQLGLYCLLRRLVIKDCRFACLARGRPHARTEEIVYCRRGAQHMYSVRSYAAAQDTTSIPGRVSVSVPRCVCCTPKRLPGCLLSRRARGRGF